ncbi:MAG: right-handed parallel beta-helix repeat-containing protein [Opitutaceae bacterium]|jgi:hypothetical protein
MMMLKHVACVCAFAVSCLEAAPSLQQQIDAMRGKPGAVLTLEPGSHRLPSGGLVFQGLEDVVIEGAGATLIATNPEAGALHVLGCRRVTFRGFTLDYDPLPFTQATVTAVDPASMSFEFRLHDGYPAMRERVVKDGQSVTLLPRIHLFEADAHRWKPGAPDYAASKIEKTGPRSGRATLTTDARGFSFIKEGDRIALTTLSGEAIRIGDGCADLVWEDVTVHAAPFVCFTLRSNENSGVYRRVKILPGPTPPGATQPRLISSNADGFNSAYARRGPTLEDCEFAFHGDDSVNLHGGLIPVVAWIDTTTCLAVLPFRNNRIDLLSRDGDAIRFMRAPDYRVETMRTIRSVERLDVDGSPYVARALAIWGPSGARPVAGSMSVFRIRLNAAVDPSLATEGLFVDLPALNAPGYVIRNNYFHDHRARGLRIMAGDGLIANNRFECIKQVAISIGPEYAFWREAGWVNNVTIEDNVIRDVAEGINTYGPSSYTLGTISLIGHPDRDSASMPFWAGNQNIIIRNNVIENTPIDGIHVPSSTGVMQTGNQLKNVSWLTEPERSEAGSDYGLKLAEPIALNP